MHTPNSGVLTLVFGPSDILWLTETKGIERANQSILLPRTVNFNTRDFARNAINDGFVRSLSFVLTCIAVVLGVFVVVNVAAWIMLGAIEHALKSVLHGCCLTTVGFERPCWLGSCMARSSRDRCCQCCRLDHAGSNEARSKLVLHGCCVVRISS
jgi:hypothetical protein